MMSAVWALLGASVGLGFFAFGYAEAPTLWRDEARVLFVGDMMFDRQVRALADARGDDSLFACAQDLFDSADFAVGNLEGPITPNSSASLGSVVGSPSNFVFTFPPATAALLARHNVRAVDLGNNHIGNFGSSGIASTHAYLDAADVGYFGGLAGNEPVYRTRQNGVNLSFVSYNEFGGSSAQSVAQTVASERASGRVVTVFAHWGDEYVDSRERLRPLAALFVQSGAALVVGAHPHVVLPSERMPGPDGASVPVYYSLGNFIFDQYWQESVRNGLAIEVGFTGAGAPSVVEHPVVIARDGSTCPLAMKVF